jgi:hypothetical protein
MAMKYRRYRVNQSHAAGDKPHEIHFVWGFPHYTTKGKTMTTKNIKQIPQARGMVKAIAEDVKKRSLIVAGELGMLDKDEDDIRIGSAAMLQSIEDDRTPLAEEREQLISILAASRRDGGVADGPITINPPAQPVEEVVVPATAEPVAPINPPAQPVEEVVVPATAPVEGTEVLNLGPTTDVPARFNRNPFTWGHGQWRSYWWVIVLCTIVTLFLAGVLWGAFVQDWFWNHGSKWAAGALFASIIYWLGAGLAGFFSGGYISYRLEERHAVPVVPVLAVVPVVPAPPAA